VLWGPRFTNPWPTWTGDKSLVRGLLQQLMPAPAATKGQQQQQQCGTQVLLLHCLGWRAGAEVRQARTCRCSELQLCLAMVCSNACQALLYLRAKQRCCMQLQQFCGTTHRAVARAGLA
jgi:hypothetical protein